MGDIHREVIKLLVQLAWADREIAEEERLHILEIARTANFDDAELGSLEKALTDPTQLDAPDFDLLRRYRQEVKRAAAVLLRSDAKIAPDEAVMLDQIDEMLG